MSFTFPVLIINLDRKPERFRYVTSQLKHIGISNYKRVRAIDGFLTSDEKLLTYGVTKQLSQRKGLAGCAASHILVWKYILREKLGWTLILEDDAHFHPNFLDLFKFYWKSVPADAKIVFLGYCGPKELEQSSECVLKGSVMCLQAYMISWQSAKYLLENLLPNNEPIDITIDNHFKTRPGLYFFNGNVKINGIRPNDYKERNGRKCMFNGIVYQNHEDQGSTIHKVETVF